MPDTVPPPLPQATPIRPEDRLLILDVLRGIALLGILMVNIQEFHFPQLYAAIVGVDVWQGAWDVDSVTTFVVQSLFTGRWAPIYSFLFGLGLQMMCERFASRHTSAVAVISRRLGVLFVFGLLHAVFFWYGDVLIMYSLLGFMVLLLHKVSARITLVCAVLLTLGLGALFFALGVLTFAGEMLQPGSSQFNESDWIYQHYEKCLEVYSAGSWLDIFLHRWIDNLLIWGLSLLWAPLSLACMLAGAWTVKAGHHTRLSGSRRYRQFLLPVCVVSLAVASCTALQTMGLISSPALEFLFILPASMLVMPLLSIGYVSYVVWWVEQTHNARYWQWIAAAGRMPLTNYLAQSVIASSLFYGYGFGWFGTTGAGFACSIGLVIYLCQLAFSHWWMSRHRYGPLEKLWKILTYERT